MIGTGDYETASQHILDEAKKSDPRARFLMLPKLASSGDGVDRYAWDPAEIGEVPEEWRDVGGNTDGIVPLLALLPSRKMSVRLGGIRWHVRSRASFTACALQTPDRRAKLWWTFEGVPADHRSAVRPQEADVAALMELAERMDLAATGPLRKAYSRALQEVAGVAVKAEVDGPPHVSIHMADTDDPALAVLLQKMYWENATLADFEKPPSATAGTVGRSEHEAAQVGLSRFEELVHDIVPPGAPITDADVRVTIDEPGAGGIYYRYSSSSDGGSKIAGLARRTGRSPRSQPYSRARLGSQNTENLMRAHSAARPISARLARAEGERMDLAPLMDAKP